ncbi:MAG: molybdopterin-guanine dinucleotide biosynthesis protein B [Deferribacteraceae bacterium]|jgi:molybdopterin-guanine dinucleotide biosynthesis protein B|nr:molybdopterin-guanine dinucleotide biosynthesis protein B [Deferribacteraceae bacterium]
MVEMIAFTGFSGSGKTTLVCNVVSELTRRGYKVGTIKHDGHGHDIETSGDSSKHKASGAICSIVSNKFGYLMQSDSNGDTSPQELATLMPSDCDIVICEGFKWAYLPKIEVVRGANLSGRTNEGDYNLIAIATDTPFESDVPMLDINSAQSVADFIEERFLKERADMSVTLIVNGKPIPTKDFLMKMLAHSVRGLVTPLKGCENPKEISIKVVI